MLNWIRIVRGVKVGSSVLLTVLVFFSMISMPEPLEAETWQQRMERLKRQAREASRSMTRKARETSDQLKKETSDAYNETTRKAKEVGEATGDYAEELYREGMRDVEAKADEIGRESARQYNNAKYYIRHEVPEIIERDRVAIERSIRELRKSMGLSDEEYVPPPPRATYSVPNPTVREVLFPPVVSVREPVYIKVVAQNLGSGARQGGISVAFPDAGEINVFQTGGDTTDVSVYPVGFGLYSAALGRKINAKYPVVETYSWSPISNGETYSITAFVVPARAGEFRFYVRTALRGAGKNFYGYPKGSGFATDQQQWAVLEYSLIVE